jgi:Outer membrane protein Omp28
MKYILNVLFTVVSFFFFQSCSKTESNFNETRPETITLSASTINVATGSTVNFTVLSSNNNSNVTADSKITVNGNAITGSNFLFTTAGSFTVQATKGNITSNTLTITVTALAPNSGYKHKVLVEEYSGTWCGNCPRLLFGVELLHQQTDKAITVGIHLNGGDPFITSDGNNLASQQGVSGVPTGRINRTINWTGPQFENVMQVTNTIQAFANAGLAINSAVNGSNITITVKAAYRQALTGEAKLTVYLVEDKLTHTQTNYSSNLYGGQTSIVNFKYDGVLRRVVSAISGDVIASSGTNNEKTYTLPLPSNIASIANTRVVAFITNASNAVVNVQDAKVGQEKTFEAL